MRQENEHDAVLSSMEEGVLAVDEDRTMQIAASLFEELLNVVR